jgi:hypothetical protein
MFASLKLYPAKYNESFLNVLLFYCEGTNCPWFQLDNGGGQVVVPQQDPQVFFNLLFLLIFLVNV